MSILPILPDNNNFDSLSTPSTAIAWLKLNPNPDFQSNLFYLDSGVFSRTLPRYLGWLTIMPYEMELSAQPAFLTELLTASSSILQLVPMFTCWGNQRPYAIPSSATMGQSFQQV
jgi:hypothetical protein